MTFEQLRTAFSWRPIANCPGRFVCTSPISTVSPGDLVGPATTLREYRLPHARDVVIVGRIEGGGVISYRRADGSYLHTLNTPEGLARKLEQLGVGVGPPA